MYDGSTAFLSRLHLSLYLDIIVADCFMMKYIRYRLGFCDILFQHGSFSCVLYVLLSVDVCLTPFSLFFLMDSMTFFTTEA